MTTHTHGLIEYFTKGEKPALLILSGMHGDEYEASNLAIEYVTDHEKELPDFLFIPKVSPSAMEKRTRRNAWDHDVNRQFFDDTQDAEVRDIMAILAPHRFALSLNFHEDPDRSTSFYTYDNGLLSNDQLHDFRARIVQAGASLYTGIDDTTDAALGLHVERGYISTPPDTLPQDAGLSWTWFFNHNLVDRAFDPEIPGRAQLDLKKRLIEAIFSFTLPLISQT